MRRTAFLFVAALCLAALPSVSLGGETSIDYYVGLALTDPATVKARWSYEGIFSTPEEDSASWSEHFDPSFTLGLGAKGWYATEEGSPMEVGLGFDAQYFRADGTYAEFWFLPVSIDFLLRTRIGMDEAHPDGRYRPYGGLGFSYIFGDGTARYPTMTHSVGGSLGDFGIRFLLGCSVVLTPNTALFVEVRRSQFTASAEKDPFIMGSEEKVSASIGTTHFLVGFSLL